LSRMGTLVTVHVYDVTNSSSDTANNIIIGLNKMFKDTMSLGGVFHCGVEVNMEEWSFGYCEHGTGVRSLKGLSQGPPTGKHIEAD
jgi:hypothetical protein